MEETMEENDDDTRNRKENVPIKGRIQKQNGIDNIIKFDGNLNINKIYHRWKIKLNKYFKRIKIKNYVKGLKILDLTPPRNISIISNSSDSLLITWEPPVSTVPITHYIVSVEKSFETLDYYTRNQNHCDVNNSVSEDEDFQIEEIQLQNSLFNAIYVRRPKRAMSNNPKRFQKFNFQTRNTHLYIRNLHHYTLYDVSVEACQGVKCKINNNWYLHRTRGKDAADKVNNLELRITQNNVTISWEQPKDPNAEILAYFIEYKRLDVDNAKSVVECVNLPAKSESFLYEIGNLVPGRYVVTVTSKSAFKKETSDPFYFTIDEPYVKEP